MGQWWGLVLTLLYSLLSSAASQHGRKGLVLSTLVNLHPCNRERVNRGQREKLRTKLSKTASSHDLSALRKFKHSSDKQPCCTHTMDALYPSAFRVKRGAYSLVNPTFHTSLDDVNLLFEIMLAGLQVEGENRQMLIPDAELSSLRRVDKLEVICEDILPKSLPEVRRLTSLLSQWRGHLRREDFERTMLTMVYVAQTMTKAVSDHQKALWMDTLLLLFKAIKEDLVPP